MRRRDNRAGMDTKAVTRLVMLGAAAETRGSIAAVVETYRAHGLFKRWPIDYLPTHGEGSLAQRTALALKAARALGAALVQGGRVAVHAHVAVRGFWRDAALLASALAARSPVLVQLHGTGFERFYDDCDPLARTAVRWLLERAACVLVPCESLRGWARAAARQAHVVYLPNPVALEPLAKDPCRPNLVLFLGHMAADKGVFDLLEAVSAVRAAVPELRLVCAGDGERIAVARYAERLGIADAVKFTGWVGPSGKRALFESAALLAAPAYDAALPTSLLEAMAAGVPVVAAAVGGIPELIVDGVSGFLVAPGDSASLARVLRKLLLERELGARIGAAARESVRLRYAPERAVPKLEEIYASIGLQSTAEPPAPVREADLRKAA
jgi:glycosyltransferase involved in cell wall biosynthesis